MEWIKSFLSFPSRILSYSSSLLLTMPSEDPLTQDSDSTSVETTTVADVLAVKQLLFDVIKDAYEKKGVHDKNLPWEIVEMIIDYAEFWAHTSVNAKWEDGGCLRARGSSDRENVFVVS